MNKLSLCMIVKNEEIALPKCLESVKNVVDEMIVMDTGSTDKTVEIAQSYGAKVPKFTWCNHFSQARNEALKYVQGKWVLVLDADEVLNPEIVPQMQQAMQGENHLVINFLRQEIGAIQSPYSLVSRLFRNHPQVKFTRPYHSIVDDSVAELFKIEPNWKVIDLPLIGIFHYGYTPEMIQSLDKYERARKAMEGYFKEHPNDAYICNKLGALYLQIGRKKEGAKLLIKGLKSNKADIHTLYELHYHLANAYVKEQKLESAIKHYQKALEQPILPKLKLGAYNNLGSLLQSVGDLQNAQKAYETTIKIEPNFFMGYYNLGMTLKGLGKLTEAVKLYQKAIEINSDYAPAYQNLGVTLFKIGNLADSLVAFERAIALYNIQDPQMAEKLRQGLKEMGIRN